MRENVSSQGVTVVRRIKVRRNNELLPTNTFILTFNVPILPPSIKAGNFNVQVESQIPCDVSNVRGLDMDRTHVMANLYVLNVVFQTVTVRHARTILCVQSARETTEHTRKCPRWKLAKQVSAGVHNASSTTYITSITKKQKEKTGSENKETVKDTKKTNVSPDRLKKAEHRLQTLDYQDYLQTKKHTSKTKNNCHKSPLFQLKLTASPSV